MTKVTRNIYLSVFSVGFIAIFSIIQMHINLLSKRTERIVEALKEQDKAITELERAVSLIQYNGRTNKPEAKKQESFVTGIKQSITRKATNLSYMLLPVSKKGLIANCTLMISKI